MRAATAVGLVGPAVEQHAELVAAEPRRHARRAQHRRVRRRARPPTSSASPAAWPRLSLIGLNPSRSRKRTASRRGAARGRAPALARADRGRGGGCRGRRASRGARGARIESRLVSQAAVGLGELRGAGADAELERLVGGAELAAEAAVLADNPHVGEGPRHRADQRLVVGALAHEVEDARVDRVEDGVEVPVAGEHHERRGVVEGVEAAHDLEPVEARHVEVADNHVRRARGGEGERLLAARRREDLPPLGREGHRQELERDLRVVDDEHAGALALLDGLGLGAAHALGAGRLERGFLDAHARGRGHRAKGAITIRCSMAAPRRLRGAAASFASRRSRAREDAARHARSFTRESGPPRRGGRRAGTPP